MRFRSVVLPLPEGPTNETKDEGSIVKLTDFKASTRSSPRVYTLVKSWAEIKLIIILLTNIKSYKTVFYYFFRSNKIKRFFADYPFKLKS